MVAGVLLHIGMHKTGTTALQSALDGYDDGRIRHARLGHANHSIAVVTAFATEPHRYHVWQRVGATREQVARERARLQATLAAELALDRDRLIVVGEEISLLPTAPVSALAQTLRQGGREVSVLAYLRDPAGYVTSAFQQQVRGGQSCFTLPRPHYRPRFAKFLATFGSGAVSFRPYRPAAFRNGSVISDFAAVAGLPADALPDRRANPSLPLDAVRLVHLLNRSIPQARSEAALAARSAVIRHLGGLFSDPFTLPPDITAGIIDRDEIAWLEDASGIGFGPLADPVPTEIAERALARHMAAIPPEACDRLRAELARQGLPCGKGMEAADLVTTLYHALLAQTEDRLARTARPSGTA